jgi:hypothetical protein
MTLDVIERNSSNVKQMSVQKNTALQTCRMKTCLLSLSLVGYFTT